MKFVLIGGAVLAALYVGAYKGLFGVKAAELTGGTQIPAMRDIPFGQDPQALGVTGSTITEAPVAVGPTKIASQQKTGQIAGTAAAVGTGVAFQAAGGTAAVAAGSTLAAAIPIVGAVIATGIGLFTALNKPYGTCAPDAPDSAAFLQCWNHPPSKGSHGEEIPQIPYWKGEPTSKQPGTRGWDFAFCRGASGFKIGSQGCNVGGKFNSNENPNVPCDCSKHDCVCAPAGAVLGLHDGTFVNAAGRNLGPAVAQVRKA